MFTHVMVGTNDFDRAVKFYDAVMGALGHTKSAIYGERKFYTCPTGMFGVGKPANGEAACHANGGTIGFAAADEAAVDAAHAAGLANGGTCDGAPGVREGAGNARGAYLRDPDGNKICFFHGLNI